MGHIYFVRHGQSVWNVENKICGATDIELTELGHQQAIETGKEFIKQGIQADEILYSPLSRAAETARHISEMTGIPARMEERLREQNFGKYESTARDGAEFKEAKKQFVCRYDGGESMLHLAQRIYNLLDDIKAEAVKKTYILVAHNGIARVIQSYFYEMTNEEYASFGVKNCTILRYDFDTEENLLIKNIDKLHTTELGVVRIKQNLSLDTEDVVAWCREKILNPSAIISRKGKNWYVWMDGCEITINATSYTIITAHQKNM